MEISTRDSSPGHAGKEGPHLAMMAASRGFSRLLRWICTQNEGNVYRSLWGATRPALTSLALALKLTESLHLVGTPAVPLTVLSPSTACLPAFSWSGISCLKRNGCPGGHPSPAALQLCTALASPASSLWVLLFHQVWKIPWMEEPRRLQSMGSLRVGQD